MTVPTVLSMLLDVPVEGLDLSRLRYAMCGAAPLSVQVFRAFEERTGLKLLEGYGLTEATVVSSCNPRDGERKVGSVGLRIPYQEMKTVILDDDGEYLRDCRTDEIGVIVMRGPNVFQGYVEEAHNQGVWVDGDWLNTGDMGRMDEDQYTWLTGRKKELIIRGGHNIDPAVVEEVLYQIDGVAEAAAVGQPDRHAGEVVVAFVTPKAGVKLEAEEIERYCRENITERAAIPKNVHIIDPMPVTAVGKIFKPALRHQAIREVFTAELEALSDLVESIDVVVREEKTHGTTAYVTAEPAAGVDRGEDPRARRRHPGSLHGALRGQIDVAALDAADAVGLLAVVADEEAVRRVLDGGGIADVPAVEIVSRRRSRRPPASCAHRLRRGRPVRQRVPSAGRRCRGDARRGGPEGGRDAHPSASSSGALQLRPPSRDRQPCR